jgi:tRNA nucleotidyltransferase (CCA-adding enzyme)
MDELRIKGEAVIERVSELPGGPQLLDLGAGREDVELVGGAARDLLLGRTPRELDVVVDEDAPSFAGDLAAGLGLPPGEDPHGRSGVTLHERFGTAAVSWQDGRIDIACRRAESYATPGALPDVRPGTRQEDLCRRDFTVNAIAVSLGGPHRGELSAAPHALEDLAAGRLRVLHERSFLDDPTRLLRLARYLARLEFEPEPDTADLAAEALASGALATVSGARIGAELRLALEEPDAPATFATLTRLGVLSALHPHLRLQERLARAAIATLPEDGRADVLILATVLLSMTEDPAKAPERAIRGLLDDLEFTAGDRDQALKAALLAPALVCELQDLDRPSQLRDALHLAPLEAVALAAAIGEEQGLAQVVAGARRWLSELRQVRLGITGDDLLAAGVPPGPEIGQGLELALRRKLDGELSEGREAELSAALEGP